VSIGSQRLTVYDRNGRVMESSVSSGQRGFETPQGVFSVIERNREHFSNLYNDAPMPNMQRITWSGVAMHAGNLPGYPASHGCIRLPYNVSARLFELTKLGTRVVVAQHDPAPVAFEHPRLFTSIATEALTILTPDTSTPAKPEPTMSPPMMLGAALPLTPPPVTSALTPGVPAAADPFAARPAGTTRAAWATELMARLQPLDATAKATKAKAAIAEKDAVRAMGQVLATERAKSALAAKLAALEGSIARGGAPTALARAEQAKLAAETKLAELVADTDRLRAVEAEKRTIATHLAAEAAEAGQTRDATATIAREANRRLKPVSVFVSRKAGRLFVRQGFQPLFDEPVEIDDATAPIGTHVYTALEQKNGSDAMRWSAVTVVGSSAAENAAPVGKKARAAQASASPKVRQTASAALDRVRMADGVRQRIGELLMPGSSLIISDHGVSNETGKGTDFVILTK
jgi:L,D-transpeptidase catalytic domain